MPKPNNTYKQKLLDARKLAADAKSSLFDRVAILVEVFEDRDFRLDLGDADDINAAKALDAYLEDCAYDFLQCRAIIQEFPSRHAWTQRKLADLYQEAIQRQRPQRQDEPRRTRTTVTMQQYAEVEKQVAHHKAVAENLKVQAKSLAEQLAEARARIRDLEREVALMRNMLKEARPELVAAR